VLGWYQVVTPSARAYLNEVVLSQLVDDDADRVIDEMVATYRPHGVRMRWIFNPQTRPACLQTRGVQYAVTHAHEATSAPILEHLGFETLYTGTSWCLAP
jgi:hypothetical protein